MVRVIRVTAVIGGGLAVIGLATLIAGGHGEALWSELSWVFALFAIFFAVVVWLVVPGQPGNAVVWVMTASAFFGGLWIAGLAGAAAVVDDPNLVLVSGESVVPAVLPQSAAWIMMFTYPAVLLTLFAPLTFGLLLFPDGRLPSPRWRWVGWLAGASMVVLTVGYAWGFRPDGTEPADAGVLVENGFWAVGLAIILSLAALVIRYRRSSGTTRQQFKWVVWGASIYAPTQIAAFIFGGTQYEDLILLPFLVGMLAFLVSYGIAVGKYRLFDIDIVINKTVLVAVLGAVIAALYVGVVVGVGSLFGDGTQVGVQVAATVMVALAFGPVRRLAQQWADRAVYGERATPYEVLARFSHRAAETSDDQLLARIPRLIVDGTGAAEATLWVRSHEGFRPAAAWPESADRSAIPRPTRLRIATPTTRYRWSTTVSSWEASHWSSLAARLYRLRENSSWQTSRRGWGWRCETPRSHPNSKGRWRCWRPRESGSWRPPTRPAGPWSATSTADRNSSWWR
jgi:hypothetical protein